MKNNKDIQTKKALNTITTRANKSYLVVFFLTFIFGPFGIFYVSTIGGVVASLIGIMTFIFTMGIGSIFVWPIFMIWGVIDCYLVNRKTNKSNNKLQEALCSQSI